eukprot:GFKZ01008797.1.p1 GENE.GFKZ01008797.1~~GFKZ01008797.1.p1  ORF type:complete len:126 (+),score=17.52 GFKZ01008797.1:87-464(+)
MVACCGVRGMWEVVGELLRWALVYHAQLTVLDNGVLELLTGIAVVGRELGIEEVIGHGGDRGGGYGRGTEYLSKVRRFFERRLLLKGCEGGYENLNTGGDGDAACDIGVLKAEIRFFRAVAESWV